MTDQIKEKVLGMNSKKGFLNLLLCAIIFTIVAGAGTIIKFGSRIPEVRAQMEQMKSTRQEEHLQYASEEEDRQQEGNFWDCIHQLAGSLLAESRWNVP